MGILVSLLLILRSVIVVQPSKLEFVLSRCLATNSFGLGILFFKSPAAKMLGAVAAKMVATWRVVVAFKKGGNELMF